ncbi:thiamine pyridinylase [Streptomyces fradiae]|uniref:thiamine pyridinylase n=1 Tax=Streptomyces fradiae TaxID=1906 RepID=UPI0033CB1C5F
MSQALIPKGELAVRTAAPRESGPGELTVALYPYVPNPQLFQDKVSQAWAALGTGYALSFQTYDPYSGPPAPTIDVFAFDCSFSGSLVGEYAVSPLRPDEVDSPEDLYPFARDAATDADGHFVGIPYLGCCSTLYYRDGDQPLGKPELSLDALFAVLGAAPDPTKEIPAPGQGLIVELRGSTTDACMYQQAWEQLNGGCVPEPPLPAADRLDPRALDALRKLVKMAGVAQAAFRDPGSQRVKWFEAGLGRAMVGFTEWLPSMSPGLRKTVQLRALPLGPGRPTPCYADAIGIRRGLEGEDRAAAVRLANLVASSDLLQSAVSSQYLVPARVSALRNLAQRDPVYARIQRMLDAADPCGFRLGPGGRLWIKEVGPKIVSGLLGISMVTPPVSALSAEAPDAFESTPAGIWRRGF